MVIDAQEIVKIPNMDGRWSFPRQVKKSRRLQPVLLRSLRSNWRFSARTGRQMQA